MSVKINKNGKEYDLGFVPEHYPADRVYLDGDISKTVQDAVNEFETFSLPTERGLIIFRKIGHTVFVTGVNTKFTSLPITFPAGFAPLENAIRAVGYINEQTVARGVLLTNNQISIDGDVAVDWFNFTFSYLSNDAVSS